MSTKTVDSNQLKEVFLKVS